MIDLHCHLLPAIDDGPSSIEESEALARAFVANGITHAVATPHIHPGRYDNDIDSIRAAFEQCVEMLQQKSIPLNVAMAAEVRICPEILSMIPAGKIPFVGKKEGKSVLLLEFPHSHLLPGTENMLRWLMDRDIVPLIAHPERNKDITYQPEKLRPFINMGCLVQVTAGSVSGRFGDKVQESARYMLSQGWVTVLATDAHNLAGRPPELHEGMDAAISLIGSAKAISLVKDTPMEICDGMFSGAFCA